MGAGESESKRATMGVDAVRALPAGRTLDALVAERVMGLTPAEWRSRCYVEHHNFDGYEYDASSDPRETGWCYTCACSVAAVLCATDGRLPLPYSTDDATALTVLPVLRAAKREVSIYYDAVGFEVSALDEGRGERAGITVVSATLAHALSLVAVLAVLA